MNGIIDKDGVTEKKGNISFSFNLLALLFLN